MRNLKNIDSLEKDEEELFDILICSGLEKVISLARTKMKEENDSETFLAFLVEIQNLLMKLGYDFKFEVKEIKKYEM